jgi:putative lipoprotein
MQVRGTVRVEQVRSEVRDAVTTVRLLDVSRADAASVTVAEVTVADCSLRPGAPGRIPFRLEVPELDPRATYALSAHIDTTGSGDRTVGDYVTTEHVPVPPRGEELVLDVPAQVIG